MKSFQELGLSDQWVAALAKRNITQPTEIQEQAIPILLQNKTDFIGLAQTGTGKTAAYGLPAMSLCPEGKGTTRYLVVSPTRELAMQIASELEKFSAGVKNLRILPVYGGAPITGQLRELRQQKPHILVATPGRLLDLLKRKAVAIDEVEAVILDEADEMLNMGFKEDVHAILAYTGKEKNVWMFSATMPPAIRDIANTFMTNPQVVTVNAKQKMNENIIHQYCKVTRGERTIALQRFLDYTPDVYGLIFCRTRKDTQEVADELVRNGYRAEALHGELSQAQRERVMGQFKRKSLQLVVATDVAARGIDVEDLTHVFHHGMPQDTESFAHRSGRTARAGKSGISIALIGHGDIRGLQRIEKQMKINIAPVAIPSHKSVIDQKLNVWADSIVNTNSADANKKLVASLAEKFEELSKEQLLEKLVAQQVASFGKEKESVRQPRTEASDSRRKGAGDSRRNGGSSDKPFRRSPERSSGNGRSAESANGAARYFINVGHVDGVDKQSLTEFVSEQGNVSKSDIDRITIKERFSFFDLTKARGKALEERFEGLMVNGRKLRINLDTE